MIGILLLLVVLFIYYLVYRYFMKRTDTFMEQWEEKLKEEVEPAIKSLTEAAISIKRPLQKATDAIESAQRELDKTIYEIKLKQRVEKREEEKFIPFIESLPIGQRVHKSYPGEDKTIITYINTQSIITWKSAKRARAP